MSGPDKRKVLYRETHSSRAVVATLAAVLVLVLCAYGLLESGVHAIGQPAWLIEPQAAAERLVALPAGVPPLLLGALGAVLAMIGLFFLLNAILPGRRARHVLSSQEAGSDPGSGPGEGGGTMSGSGTPDTWTSPAVVVVSRRQVVVNVRPTSGVPVEEAAVRAAVEGELGEMALVPAPEVRVNLASAGVIGA
jgi:hypothetical protein